MNPDSVVERLATIEAQNSQCAKEREELDKNMQELMGMTHQIKGSIRVLVILWTIAVSAGGVAAARYIFEHVSPAAASSHP